MLKLILGGCGTGKSTRMTQRIKDAITAGKEVMVIVPEQFSFEEEKKLYGALGAEQFNRIRTFSFTTLSRHILSLYGEHQRSYAGEQEKLLYLYDAVQKLSREGALTVFRKTAHSSDALQSMMSLITKIRKAGVSAQKMLDTAQKLPDQLADKMCDIGNILYAYDCILEAHGTHDGLVNLTEAAAIANMQDFFQGKEIFLDEFDSFTGDQYLMLDVMIAFADCVTAAIRTDEPDARISPIFEGGNQTRRQLRRIAEQDHHLEVEEEFCETYCRSHEPDLTAVSTKILRPAPAEAEYCGNVRIAEAPDAAAETEWICASILRMLADDPSLRCRDIVIAVKDLDCYEDLFTSAMKRYALPFYLGTAKSILHTDLVQYLLSVLSLLSEEEFRTEQLLRCLKSPFSGFRTVDVSMLEHYCFTWNIEGENWRSPFWEEDSLLAEQAREFGGERLEKTRKQAIEEFTKLGRQCRGKDTAALCLHLYKHLLEKKDAYAKRLQLEDILQQREFATLWNLVMDVLDTIVLCLGEETMEIQAIHDIAVLLCQTSCFSTPPQTLDSIQIVSAQSARLDSPKVVFVPGAVEDSFPGEIRVSGVFSQQELEQLSEQGIALSRMFFELYSDERLIVSKILSAPTQHLALSYPLRGEGEFTTPSPVIHQILRMFGDALVLEKTEEFPLSYYAWTHASMYYHFVRNLQNDSPELASMQLLLDRDPLYAAKTAKLADGGALEDHPVPAALMQKFLGEHLFLSPSGIETFYRCPYQYFTGYCLRLYVPEKRELSSLHLGNFAHYCFEQILQDYPGEQFTRLTEEQLTAEIGRLSASFSESAFSDSVRRDSRFQTNYRMAGMSLLQVLLHMQREMRESAFAPIGFEVQMGSGEQAQIPPLLLRDGAIECGGKIDRIDLCQTPDGSIVRVIDYKTGTKLFSPEKLAHGLDMQMLIYLFALQASEEFRNCAPGGVLYMPSGQLQFKHYEERNSKTTSPDRVLNDFYCMKGLLHEKAAPHMEPEIAQGCTPVLTQNGDASLFSVSDEQMEKLRGHVMERITNMADQLYAGEILPAPYLNFPCSYCSCRDMCHRLPQPVESLSDNEKFDAITKVFGTEEEVEA